MYFGNRTRPCLGVRIITTVIGRRNKKAFTYTREAKENSTESFFSFHYKKDNWRAAQVRNIGAIEGNVPLSDNDWEKVKKGGDKEIKKWINDQLKNRTCTIVLVGEKTAGRKWIKYEIERSWKLGKGVMGICIHNLKDHEGNQSQKGRNPFDDFTLGDKRFSDIVKLYDPPYKTSSKVYDYIATNIAAWVEEAIAIRKKHSNSRIMTLNISSVFDALVISGPPRSGR